MEKDKRQTTKNSLSVYFLYILRCNDGTYYTGITMDVARRVQEHNISKRGAKYTRGRRPVKLVYQKRFHCRSSALRAECRMKDLSKAEKKKVVRKLKENEKRSSN